MKLEEFLKENEGKAGMAEKLTPESLAAQGVELSDEELDMATGGITIKIPVRTTLEEYRKDEKGRVTHWRIRSSGKIYYYGCPRCGRVTHLGDWGFVYCDPCNTYWNVQPDRRVFIN